MLFFLNQNVFLKSLQRINRIFFVDINCVHRGYFTLAGRPFPLINRSNNTQPAIGRPPPQSIRPRAEDASCRVFRTAFIRETVGFVSIKARDRGRKTASPGGHTCTVRHMCAHSGKHPHGKVGDVDLTQQRGQYAVVKGPGRQYGRGRPCKMHTCGRYHHSSKTTTTTGVNTGTTITSI